MTDTCHGASPTNIHINILHDLNTSIFEVICLLHCRLDNSSVIKRFAANGETLVILYALKEHLCATFDVDYVVLEEFEEDAHIIHIDEHHAPGELGIHLHDKRFDL